MNRDIYFTNGSLSSIHENFLPRIWRYTILDRLRQRINMYDADIKADQLATHNLNLNFDITSIKFTVLADAA